MWNAGTYAKIITALLVVSDPIGTIPAFISLTGSHTLAERRHTINIAAGTAASTLVASVFLGQSLLGIFGISIPSFRVGGGIIIMLMAIAMLLARPSPVQHGPGEETEARRGEDVAVVPLGVPIIAGPGAISAVIIYADQSTGWLDTLLLAVVCVCVIGVMWIALFLADPIRKLLGTTGINVVTRLEGLILTAVAVEFITSGLSQLLPGLARP